MTRINVGIEPTNLPDELLWETNNQRGSYKPIESLTPEMKLGVYYKIRGTRITSWIKMKDGYYVFDDVWIVGGRGGNKRGFIKRALENHLKTVSHRTNYPPYDSPVYHTKIESGILVKNLEEFKSNLFELERNLLKELEKLNNESLVGVRE